MTTEKLIEIAASCQIGECDEECPFYGKRHSWENIITCMEDFITLLKNRLEKATEDIAVNCSTCIHKGKSYKEPPCSICKPLEYTKWQWRGDAE